MHYDNILIVYNSSASNYGTQIVCSQQITILDGFGYLPPWLKPACQGAIIDDLEFNACISLVSIKW